MEIRDILVVGLFVLLAAALVFCSTRFKIGGCGPCRARRQVEPEEDG